MMMHSTASAQNLVRAKPCADSSTAKSMPFCVQNVVVWAIASLNCATKAVFALTGVSSSLIPPPDAEP